MISCFVKPWIQIVLQQFTAYVLGVQDDKMTPADTGRNSWPVMADQKWSTMKNSHDSVLNMSPKMPTIYQIDVGGTTMGPWVSGISYINTKNCLKHLHVKPMKQTNMEKKNKKTCFFVGRVMVSIPEIPTKPAIKEMPSKTSSQLNPVTPARRWL